MSDSIELYRRGHEAAEKLDYFICGVAGAIFAYLGQGYKPHKIELSLTLIEPLALALLAGAFFAGIKRIEMCNAATHINHEQLKVDEQNKELLKLMEDSEENRKMFEPQWAAVLQRKVNLDKTLRDAQRKAKIYYHLRNKLLTCGFVAVVLSKLLSPYAAN